MDTVKVSHISSFPHMVSCILVPLNCDTLAAGAGDRTADLLLTGRLLHLPQLKRQLAAVIVAESLY